MGSVELHALGTLRARYTDVRLNGCLAQFKIDSGEEVMVVSPSFPGLPVVLNEVEAEVSGPANLRLHMLGAFIATFEWPIRG